MVAAVCLVGVQTGHLHDNVWAPSLASGGGLGHHHSVDLWWLPVAAEQHAQRR